jgi:hypothetical protein
MMAGQWPSFIALNFSNDMDSVKSLVQRYCHSLEG